MKPSFSTKKLFSKEMERKEFLLYTGLLLLAVIGISHRVNSVHELFNKITSQRRPANSVGFGSGSYGGVQKGGRI